MKTKITQLSNAAGEPRWEIRKRLADGRQIRRRFESLALAEAASKSLRPSIAYLIAAEGSPLVKIGQAVDVSHRLMNLQSGSPVRLYLLATFDEHDGRELERRLHRELAHARKHGEWFDLGADPLAVVNALVA